MRRPLTEQERFMDKVTLDAPSSCWRWTAAFADDGYGRFMRSGRKLRLAHRASYEMFVGEIPERHQLHHLCKNGWCVAPRHLMPVTVSSHRRLHRAIPASHCRNGHVFDEENTYVTGTGRRQCRICNRRAVARYRKRVKA